MKTSASIPRIAATITIDTTRGIGSLRGSAAQLSLPSMLRPLMGLGLRRRRGGLRTGPWGHALLHDVLEQIRTHRAVGGRREVGALPGERGVGRLIERWAGAVRLSRPGGVVS